MNHKIVLLPFVLQTDTELGVVSSQTEDVVDHPEQCNYSISCIYNGTPSAICSGPCCCNTTFALLLMTKKLHFLYFHKMQNISFHRNSHPQVK